MFADIFGYLSILCEGRTAPLATGAYRAREERFSLSFDYEYFHIFFDSINPPPHVPAKLGGGTKGFRLIIEDRYAVPSKTKLIKLTWRVKLI